MANEIPLLTSYDADGKTRIINLPTATNPGDSISLSQVQSLISAATLGVHKVPVLAATVAALPTVVYANGTAGVGATLTASANGVLTIDGKADFTLGDRVLIKNQATAANNGIYTLTTLGTVGAPFELTRATDFDSAAEMEDGSYVHVLSGDTLDGTVWILDTAVTTVGTDAVTFGVQTTVVAGDGTTVTNGNQVNVKVDGVTVTINDDNELVASLDGVGTKAVSFLSTDWSTDTLSLSSNDIGLGTSVEIGADVLNGSGQLVVVSYVSANNGTLVLTKDTGVTAFSGKALCSSYAA